MSSAEEPEQITETMPVCRSEPEPIKRSATWQARAAV